MSQNPRAPVKLLDADTVLERAIIAKVNDANFVRTVFVNPPTIDFVPAGCEAVEVEYMILLEELYAEI